MTHSLPCQEKGGLADFWYLDDGEILCHPVLVLPCLQAFDDTADAKIGAESNRQKTEVHLPLLRSGTILLLTGKSTNSAHWPPSTRRRKATLHSRSQWDHGVVSQTNSWQKCMISEPCTNAFSYVRTRRPEFALSSAKSTRC